MTYKQGESNLLVIFHELDNIDHDPYDWCFAKALNLAASDGDGEILWFRKAPPSRLPKLDAVPRPQYLRKIIMHYGYDQVDKLVKRFGGGKIYSSGAWLKAVFVSFFKLEEG